MPFVVSYECASNSDVQDESATADNSEIPAKKTKQSTCFLVKYNMCTDTPSTSTDLFTEEDIIHVFDVKGDHHLDTDGSKQIDLCNAHYKALQKLKETCTMCLSRRRPVRPASKEKYELLQLYRYTEKLDIKIYKKCYICKECLKILVHFESTGPIKEKSLEIIKDLYSQKKKETPCNGVDCCESALTEIVLHVCHVFHMKRAALFSTVYKEYTDTVAKCHPQSCSNSTLLNQKKLEQFLQDTFGDNLKLSVLDGERRLGTMIRWKTNDMEETLHKLLFQQICKDQTVEDIYMKLDLRETPIKTESMPSASTSKENNEEDMKVLERCLVILRSKMKEMVNKIDDSDASGNLDLTTINLERFLLEFCDPVLWNFYLQLSLGENETMKLQKEKFTWSKHFITPLRSNETVHARFYVLCLVNFIYTSGKTRYPYHLAIADVVDKYTNSSKKCIMFLNALGISVSKDSLQRHKTVVLTFFSYIAFTY